MDSYYNKNKNTYAYANPIPYRDDDLIQWIFPNAFNKKQSKAKSILEINERVKPEVFYSIFLQATKFDFNNFRSFIKSLGMNVFKNQGSNYDFSIMNEMTFKQCLLKNTHDHDHERIKKVLVSLIYFEQKQLAFDLLSFLKKYLEYFNAWRQFYQPFYEVQIIKVDQSKSNKQAEPDAQGFDNNFGRKSDEEKMQEPVQPESNTSNDQNQPVTKGFPDQFPSESDEKKQKEFDQSQSNTSNDQTGPNAQGFDNNVGRKSDEEKIKEPVQPESNTSNDQTQTETQENTQHQYNIENIQLFSQIELLQILNEEMKLPQYTEKKDYYNYYDKRKKKNYGYKKFCIPKENPNLEFHRGVEGFIDEYSQQHIRDWQTYQDDSDEIKNLYQDLEWDHAFIQWIFPNFFKSQFNPDSRRLNIEERNTIIKTPEQYLQNFKMFLRFLGIIVKENGTNYEFKVVDEDQFKVCIFQNTHNLMRLQRVFASLSVLGQRKKALQFLSFLKRYLGNFMEWKNDFQHFQILKEEDSKSNISFEDVKNFYFQQDLLDKWVVTHQILTDEEIDGNAFPINQNYRAWNNQFNQQYDAYQNKGQATSQYKQNNSSINSNNNQLQQVSYKDEKLKSSQKASDSNNQYNSLKQSFPILNWKDYLEETEANAQKLYNDMKDNQAFIEWIFPNFIYSIYSTNNMRLTLEERNEIISSKELTDFYLNNFLMFMRFLGIKVDLDKKSNQPFRISGKTLFDNFNFSMWMKRILASLSVLGQRELALNLLSFLKDKINSKLYIDLKCFEIVQGEKRGNASNISFFNVREYYFDQDLLNKWYVGIQLLTKTQIYQEEILIKGAQLELSKNKVINSWKNQISKMNDAPKGNNNNE